MSPQTQPPLFQSLLNPNTVLAALQWLLFMFTNTLVIPIAVAAAFDLSLAKMTMLMQVSFVLVGAACVVQGLLGHRRPVMEGQSGLWWAVILSLAFSAHDQGMSLTTVGGSLAIGIFLSALVNIVIGLSGLGYVLARLFNPGVMGVFMFLFGVKLIEIFMKGMLGLPFGQAQGAPTINLSVSALSIVIVCLVTFITVRAKVWLARYALLIGLIVGWIAWSLAFTDSASDHTLSGFTLEFFPLGEPVWNTGIIVTCLITGILNLANTFGAMKGTEPILQVQTSRSDYRRSLTISGIWVGFSGLLGAVPFAPYVSSIGYLQQTGIYTRLPFILGNL